MAANACNAEGCATKRTPGLVANAPVAAEPATKATTGARIARNATFVVWSIRMHTLGMAANALLVVKPAMKSMYGEIGVAVPDAKSKVTIGCGVVDGKSVVIAGSDFREA